MFTFIDVSHYDAVGLNGLCNIPVNWSKQIANGAKLAFIKSSEYHEDSAFKMQWAAARQAGLILGAWHYFHPSISAISQAQLQIGLLKQVGLRWTGDKRTSDKIQLDLETLDGMNSVAVMKAAASWYYEIHKAFPQYEIDIYVGYYFWSDLLIGGASGAWAKDTDLWLPSYPLDPRKEMVNPPAPFSAAQVTDMAKEAFGKYASKVPPPWTSIAYRQITAWADSKQVPGHPGIKKVVDINVTNLDFGPVQSVPVPVPVPMPIPVNGEYIVWIPTWIFATPNDGFLCKCIDHTRIDEIVILSDINGEWAKISSPVTGWVRLKNLRKA